MSYRRRRNGPADADITVILAHGAGAPMDTPFMETTAKGIARAGFRVVRFEFPYMRERRISGSRRPPNPQRVLLEAWREEIRALKKEPQQIVIGGKSMGGRMASFIADEYEVRALICMGYPFHPPGKPERLRTEHLKDIETPALIVQGERDTFGTRDEVKSYDLSPMVQFSWMKDGDHNFKPRKRAGTTEEENVANAVASINAFLSV